MSMYQHQQGSQQLSHSTGEFGYAQKAPLQQYSYHSSHYSQPSYMMDASSFRRDYAARLSELTINSRPIIQNLSIIAQEFTRFADTVTQCLEAHIRRVSFCFIHYDLMRCSEILQLLDKEAVKDKCCMCTPFSYIKSRVAVEKQFQIVMANTFSFRLRRTWPKVTDIYAILVFRRPHWLKSLS